MDNTPTREIEAFLYSEIRQFRNSRRPRDFEDTDALLAEYVAKKLSQEFSIRWEMR